MCSSPKNTAKLIENCILQCFFFSSERLNVNCMFYCTQHKWSHWDTVPFCTVCYRPQVAIYCHIQSYQQRAWIQSSCQYSFIINSMYLPSSFYGLCFCMSACLRLNEWLVAADRATESPTGNTADAVRFGQESDDKTGSPVFVMLASVKAGKARQRQWVIRYRVNKWGRERK